MSSFSFAILYGLAGVEGGGVIILPVFPLGLESEFIVPLSSLDELATALVPAEELADPLLLSSLDELATALVPAEELADPLLLSSLGELADPLLLSSLVELATALVPAEELAVPLLLLCLEQLATALVPAEELVDPLPLDDVAPSSCSFAILYGLAGVEGGGAI